MLRLLQTRCCQFRHRQLISDLPVQTTVSVFKTWQTLCWRVPYLASIDKATAMPNRFLFEFQLAVDD